MLSASPPLIVGAGPVGLAAALFLAQRDVPVRIIDKRPSATPYSKALAINPRSLELLESTGVTQQLLGLGCRMQGATIGWRGREVASVDFAPLPHPYPFMLALSQAATERLLTQALAQRGIPIERQVELVDSPRLAQGEAELLHLPTERRETVKAPWILAADGAHSTVRKTLQLRFPGNSYDRAWVLDDVPLETDLPADRAHVQLLDDGFLVLIPVYTGEQAPGHTGIWRVIGNYPDPLVHLQEARITGQSLWNSSFHIAHRIVQKMQVGQVYLAGDAAHLHSPFGARGMNLGIEDAWVFAQLAARGDLARYHDARWPVDRQVVKRIARVTWAVKGESPWARLARNQFMPRALRFAPIRRQMLRVLTGLDHPSPDQPSA